MASPSARCTRCARIPTGAGGATAAPCSRRRWPSAARYDTVILTTLIPDLYAKFGFRPLGEHAFVRALASPRPAHVRPACRVLSAEVPDDIVRLRRLLAERTPVSTRVG